jgi:hypothetical protein
MQQAISGIVPADVAEVTIMTVVPSISRFPAGRFIGRACRVQAGLGKFLTLGKLFALALMVPAMFLVLWQVRPWAVVRYRLTNRRVVIERGVQRHEEASIALDQFDRIDVVVLPGQEWYPAGDLVFHKGPVEMFRLEGVRHPEAFRRTILKAHRGYVTVREAQSRQTVVA